MGWDELQVFLAVAKSGQLSAAAKALGVDRTTVGRRITALETRLGTPVFHRTREGLVLTPAGAKARAHAERMEAASIALLSEATPPATAIGVVKLAVTEALAPFLVDQGVLSISDAHPGLRLEILAGNRRLSLKSGEADLALRIDPLEGADLKARCIRRSEVALFASRSYVKQRGAPKNGKQLDGHDVLVPSGELTHLPEARWLVSQRGVRVVFESNSLPALAAAARRDRGIVALTSLWGEREPELLRLFPIPKMPPRTIWLVTTAAAAKRPACRVVIEKIVEIFGADP